MKKLSKILAIVLCIAMALTLCACGPKNDNKDNTENNDNNENNVQTPATLTMGTGGESGTYYAFGGVLANYLGTDRKSVV